MIADAPAVSGTALILLLGQKESTIPIISSMLHVILTGRISRMSCLQ